IRVPGGGPCARLPTWSVGANAEGRNAPRRYWRRPRRARPLLGPTDRSPRDLCRSSGDRDRECAAVQGTGGAQPGANDRAGTADSDERDLESDLWITDGRAAR